MDIIKENAKLIGELYAYLKEKLGFTEDAKIVFKQSPKNAVDPLGKTAYYMPEEKKVVVYITGRHPKDIMRSLAHEICHHNQNCKGLLINTNTQEGYAQQDEHLREMEADAYLNGNMLFRDWTDGLKRRSDNE